MFVKRWLTLYDIDCMLSITENMKDILKNTSHTKIIQK